MREFVSSVRATASSLGRSSIAALIRPSACVERESGDGGVRGDAMVQRWVVRVSNCEEMADAMMSMLSRKVVTSPERISRSEQSGIWPESSAETRSMQAWSSSGRVGAREGNVDRPSMRICVDKWVDRAVVRLYI